MLPADFTEVPPANLPSVTKIPYEQDKPNEITNVTDIYTNSEWLQSVRIQRMESFKTFHEVLITLPRLMFIMHLGMPLSCYQCVAIHQNHQP